MSTSNLWVWISAILLLTIAVSGIGSYGEVATLEQIQEAQDYCVKRGAVLQTGSVSGHNVYVNNLRCQSPDGTLSRVGNMSAAKP